MEYEDHKEWATLFIPVYSHQHTANITLLDSVIMHLYCLYIYSHTKVCNYFCHHTGTKASDWKKNYRNVQGGTIHELHWMKAGTITT